MKYVLRFFGSLACLILGWFIAVCLIALTFMNSTEFLVKEDMVKKFVMDINIASFVGEDNFTEITELLEESGIPKEYTNYVLENEEVKEFIGDYASNAVDYVLYDETLPTIDTELLTEIMISSFDSVVEDINNNKIEVDYQITESEIEKVHNTINKYVPEIAEYIPDVEEFVDEQIKNSNEYQSAKEQIEQVTNVIETIKRIYSYKYLLIIGIFVGLILTFLIKFKSPKLLNWLWSPFVTACILYLLLIIEFKTLINYVFPAELEFLRNFIESNVNHIVGIWQRDFIIYLSIVIVLIGIKIFLSIKRNIKKKDKFEAIDSFDETSSKDDEEIKEESKEEKEIEDIKEEAKKATKGKVKKEASKK